MEQWTLDARGVLSSYFFGFLLNACGKGGYLEAGSSALKMGEKWSDGESLKRRVGGWGITTGDTEPPLLQHEDGNYEL